MNTEKLYALFQQHPLVSTDSRHCPQGSLFFALKGDHFDGNEYAGKALEGGAAYAVIDNPDYQNEKTILVEDVLTALQSLARYHRLQMDIPLLAITGTNGKTTTKELIASVLSTEFNILYTEGNFNNHIGVPLTLLRLKREHQIAVIEMGANHPGEIKILVDIALPTLGLITNVGKAHLEGFGSFEGVISTKGEMYDFVRLHQGKIFIDRQNEHLQKIAGELEQIPYGTTPDCYVQGEVLGSTPYLTVRIQTPDGVSQDVATQLIGDYNLSNILAAAAVGSYFGVSSAHVASAIKDYEPTNNRSQLQITHKNTLIIDAYNANPTSMKASIDNFRTLPAHQKGLIIGDMLELGSVSREEHQGIVSLIKANGFETVFLVGKEFQSVGEDLITFATVEELIHHLTDHPLEGYTLLVKGSRGICLEKILEHL